MINYLNQQLKFKNRSPPSPDYSKTPIINRARVTCTFTPTTENYCKVSMKSMKTFWDMMTNIPIGRNGHARLWETPKFMPIKRPVTCTSTHTTTDHYWKISLKSHEHFLRYMYGDDNKIYTIMNICSKFKVEATRTSW
jgi:hypothetical protein